MRRINLADAGFLIMEKREQPMHVGGINLFTLPKGVDEQQFLAGLGDLLRSTQEFRRPFGDYVKTGRLGNAGPMYWETDSAMDMDYHVRHSALPKPGRYRELFALVSRLHGTLLDRNRPLWEAHLIEGLPKRQFALYIKMHHCAIDGMGAMHLTQAMCSNDASHQASYGPLSIEAYDAYKKSKHVGRRTVVPKERDIRAIAEVLKAQLGSSANIYSLLKSYSKTWMGRGGDLSLPFYQIPKTHINSNISGARRFVAQSWPMDRIKRVCKGIDGTVNDVVLAMCGGAFRRYLLSEKELPELSLKAMVPVSTRAADDFESANSVGFITADLATNIRDPGERVRAIQDSMVAGKDLLEGLTKRQIDIYLQLAQAPVILSAALGLAEVFPAFSTVISNVPGPREDLFWNGARLDGIYPVSIVMEGIAMNITLVGYNKSLDFGIIACRRTIPHVQRMIDYLEDSLVELEDVCGVAPTNGRKKVTAKSKPKSKSKPKLKSKGKV